MNESVFWIGGAPVMDKMLSLLFGDLTPDGTKAVQGDTTERRCIC